MRAEGGVPDAQVIGDTEGSVKWLRARPWLNGKVGVFGTCSGGRVVRPDPLGVSHDHPHHALLEQAITIDFVNAALPPGTRVAVELTLESAKELSAALAGAIAAAEIEESHRLRPRR